jgi:hypothetical protein
MGLRLNKKLMESIRTNEDIVSNGSKTDRTIATHHNDKVMSYTINLWNDISLININFKH